MPREKNEKSLDERGIYLFCEVLEVFIFNHTRKTSHFAHKTKIGHTCPISFHTHIWDFFLQPNPMSAYIPSMRSIPTPLRIACVSLVTSCVSMTVVIETTAQVNTAPARFQCAAKVYITNTAISIVSITQSNSNNVVVVMICLLIKINNWNYCNEEIGKY